MGWLSDPIVLIAVYLVSAIALFGLTRNYRSKAIEAARREEIRVTPFGAWGTFLHSLHTGAIRFGFLVFVVLGITVAALSKGFDDSFPGQTGFIVTWVSIETASLSLLTLPAASYRALLARPGILRDAGYFFLAVFLHIFLFVLTLSIAEEMKFPAHRSPMLGMGKIGVLAAVNLLYWIGIWFDRPKWLNPSA